jgi:hypothetical protein
MVYDIIFLDSDRFDDQLWFLRPPKIGEVLKLNTYGSEDSELEYYVIVEVDGTTVKVAQQ